MRRAFVLAMILAAGCAPGWEASPTPHHYEIPEYGTLTLDLPAGLTETISSASGDDALYITLGTRIDDPVLAVGVRMPGPDDADFNAPERILQRFEESARTKTAELSYLPLGSPEPRGYYYVTTDPGYQPDVGEFRFMLVGGLGVDDLLVRFTLLTNDTKSASVRRALAALEGARVAKR